MPHQRQKPHLKLAATLGGLILAIALLLGFAAWKVYAAQTREIQVSVNNHSFYITSNGLGTANPSQTLQRLIHLQPIYDQQAISSSVAELATEIDQPAQEYSLNIFGNSVSINQNNQAGLAIDQNQADQAIASAFENGDNIVTLQTTPIQPEISLANAELAQAQAQKILSKNLTISYQGQTFKVPSAQIGSWINPQISAGGKITFNADKISADLQSLTAPYATAPTPMQIDLENNQVKSFTPPVIGLQANVQAGTTAVIAALQNRAAANPSPEQTVLLTDAQVIPPVPDSAAQMGIVQPIGTATTLMTGSTKSRISNIKVGAAKLNGVLIAPGQEFSTVKTLGEIDASTGYVPELSIIGDQTIPEYGGGLCQIATTLFRSALNTGLPINERQNHSYRVSYYEKDGDGKFIGPGLDATIYDPAPDLKFTNNTGHWILLTDQISGLKLTFTMYGTADGRKVAIDGPHILTSIPAPAPIYTNTDKLPVGTTQQTDIAHPGGKAIATYTVTYSDGTVKKQVFNSFYTPWPARYLVGTGTAQSPAINPAQLVNQD